MEVSSTEGLAFGEIVELGRFILCICKHSTALVPGFNLKETTFVRKETPLAAIPVEAAPTSDVDWLIDVERVIVDLLLQMQLSRAVLLLRVVAAGVASCGHALVARFLPRAGHLVGRGWIRRSRACLVAVC